MPQIHRERVLRAATSSFLTRGYRSSVDEIARRAGVAKQTVYQHFPSKDELFKAVARDLTQRVLVELDAGPRDLRGGLMRVARAYRSRVLGAQGIATLRTVVPEVPRFPALARAMYAGGLPLNTAIRVAGDASGSRVIQHATQRALFSIERGSILSQAFRETGVFPLCICSRLVSYYLEADLQLPNGTTGSFTFPDQGSMTPATAAALGDPNPCEDSWSF